MSWTKFGVTQGISDADRQVMIDLHRKLGEYIEIVSDMSRVPTGDEMQRDRRLERAREMQDSVGKMLRSAQPTNAETTS
jgi:hypothetical protein